MIFVSHQIVLKALGLASFAQFFIRETVDDIIFFFAKLVFYLC